MNYIETFGNISSAVVLISLSVKSMFYLSVINLVGASMFAYYGYLIGSFPTASLNFGIAILDAFYLIKMYKEKNTLVVE